MSAHQKRVLVLSALLIGACAFLVLITRSTVMKIVVGSIVLLTLDLAVCAAIAFGLFWLGRRLRGAGGASSIGKHRESSA